MKREDFLAKATIGDKVCFDHSLNPDLPPRHYTTHEGYVARLGRFSVTLSAGPISEPIGFFESLTERRFSYHGISQYSLQQREKQES